MIPHLVVHIDFEEGRDLQIWWIIWIWSKGEVSLLTLISLFQFLTCKPWMLASCQE